MEAVASSLIRSRSPGFSFGSSQRGVSSSPVVSSRKNNLGNASSEKRKGVAAVGGEIPTPEPNKTADTSK